jgi:rhodanese-related sulfurtransferase
MNIYKTIMLIVTIMILILAGYLYVNNNSNNKAISSMDNANFVNSLVVDVRERDEYSAAHSSKTINIPLSDIQSGKIDIFANTDKEEIVLVCRSGNRAGIAAEILKSNGINKKIVNYGAWQNLDK